MNAIAEAPLARQSLASQTGFTITEKAAPERMRPTMAWQIDGQTGRPLAHRLAASRPDARPGHCYPSLHTFCCTKRPARA
jgi:hypothetical protein